MKKVLSYLFNLDHWMIAVVSLLLTGFLFFFFSFNVSFLNPVRRAFADFSMSDVYYSILWESNPAQKNDLITLVSIDSLYERKDIAHVIEQIDRCDPKVVGLDILFEGRKSDVEGDSILTDVLQRRIDNKVIGCKLLNYDGQKDCFNRTLHSFFIEDLSFIQEGYTNALYSDAGTTLRMFSNYRYDKDFVVNSFAKQVYNNYCGEIDDVDTTQLNDRYINYRPLDFTVLRFDSIAQHPELIKDRIVLVGAMHEDADMHYTPIGRIPGLKVQAYSVQSLIDGYVVTTMSDIDVWILAFLASYVTQLVQFSILLLLKKRKGPLAMFLYGSVAFIRMVTFLWLGLIAFIAFVLYITHSLYISTSVILVAAVLTSEARGVYGSFLRHFVKRYNLPLPKNSLFNN